MIETASSGSQSKTVDPRIPILEDASGFQTEHGRWNITRIDDDTVRLSPPDSVTQGELVRIMEPFDTDYWRVKRDGGDLIIGWRW